MGHILSIWVRHDWDLAPQHCDDLWCLCSVQQDPGMTREVRDRSWELQHGQAGAAWPGWPSMGKHTWGGHQRQYSCVCCLLYFRVVVQVLHPAVTYNLLSSTSNVIFLLINLKTFHEECKVSPEIKGYREEGRTVPWCHRGGKCLSDHWFPVWRFSVEA